MMSIFQYDHVGERKIALAHIRSMKGTERCKVFVKYSCSHVVYYTATGSCDIIALELSKSQSADQTVTS
ncbi:hypothetical protein C0J52_14884 [Blattella germanica]|nr:hypothetical protein C0J52_14884 [Blattella germanica]